MFDQISGWLKAIHLNLESHAQKFKQRLLSSSALVIKLRNAGVAMVHVSSVQKPMKVFHTSNCSNCGVDCSTHLKREQKPISKHSSDCVCSPQRKKTWILVLTCSRTVQKVCILKKIHVIKNGTPNSFEKFNTKVSTVLSPMKRNTCWEQ